MLVKTIVKDYGVTKINVTMCNEPVILLHLKWLIEELDQVAVAVFKVTLNQKF